MDDQKVLPIPTNSVKPFIPRPRSKRVNWRKLGSVNLDALAQRGDYSELQSHLAYVTFCDAEAEFAGRSNDPGLVKLFRLAQLELEYLLHTQDILASSLEELANRCQESDAELEKLQKERKVLKAALLKSSAASSPCPECPKIFSSPDFLEAHLSRRHGGSNASVELLEVNRRLGEELKFMREEVADLKNKKITCSCSHDHQAPQQPSLDATELKKILATEIDSKLAGFLASCQPSTPPQVVTVQSPMPPVPPPIDVNQLKDDICGKVASEMASVKRQILNQGQFWKEQICNIEQVHKLELESLKERIEEVVKEKAVGPVVNPLYSSEDILNRILESQSRQEELLKAQENELVQLKQDSKRRDASTASLLSLTASRQFGLGRSYEEIGTAYQHHEASTGLSPDAKPFHRPSSALASETVSSILPSSHQEERRATAEPRPFLLSKSEEKPVTKKTEEGEDFLSEDEDIEDAGEDDEDLQERMKKKSRFGGLMKSIKQSLSLKKKPNTDSPIRSRKKLDFGPSKQFVTSTPKKHVGDRSGKVNDDKNSKFQSTVGSTDRSDELVGHWWEDDSRVGAGSRRLLKMADWSSLGASGCTSMASLPQNAGEGVASSGDKKFATLPARRPKSTSGRKSVSFVDEYPGNVRSGRDGVSSDDDVDAEETRVVQKTSDYDASAEPTKMSIEELCQELGSKRPQQSKPVPAPRGSVGSASGKVVGNEREESSWDDSTDDDK